MEEGIAVVGESLVGRDEELGSLAAFASAEGAWRALVLAGEPGIGKTALWEATIARAREHGLRVLLARPSESETGLSFASLADLFDGVGKEELDDLPAPQLAALWSALHRAEPESEAPGELAISTAVLNCLRSISAVRPVVVAIDDVPWVDGASADALAFASRRLSGSDVRFLFTRRGRRPSRLEHAVGERDMRRLDVGPLSFGAISHLLTERLGQALPRRLLRRIFATSSGNPLLALELGRSVLEQGAPEVGADLPLPGLIEDLFGARVDALSPPVLRVLLAIALSPELTETQLAAVSAPGALDEAAETGLFVFDAHRVRVSHPILAEVVRHKSNPRERRELHRDLATVVTDSTLRARHLALAATTPDEQLASAVASAATASSRRGALGDAIELARDALRLTEPGSPEHSDRVLSLATYLNVAGDPLRARRVLVDHLDGFPRGRAQARAYILLAQVGGAYGDLNHLERARQESRDEPEIQAIATLNMAMHLAIDRIERLGMAGEMAEDALSTLNGKDHEAEKQALVAAAWVRTMRGMPIHDLAERFPSAPSSPNMFDSALDRPAGVRHAFRGEVALARATFERLVQDADARGDARLGIALHIQLCELAIRAGYTVEAGRLVDEWNSRSVEFAGQLRLMNLRCGALLAAVTGEPGEARRLASEVAASVEKNISEGWNRLEALRASGIAALFEHDALSAVDRLSTVWNHTLGEGVDDPGAFPVAADLIEALLEAGQPEGAREVMRILGKRAAEQAHPWGSITARRGAASLRLFDDHDQEAVNDLERAAADYDRLELKFDSARTLLFLGRLQRRHKKRGDARRALEAARDAFAQLGCHGWADEARLELTRVSGRRPVDDGVLTASEARVAKLASNGLSNKEIAKQLFVSVYTVEAHLSSVYSKLGVRSRSLLAQTLKAPG